MRSLLVFLALSASIGLTNGNDPGFQQFQLAMEGYLVDLETALKCPEPIWPRFRALQVLPDGYLKCGMRHVQAVAGNICFGLNVNDYMYIQLRMLEDDRLTEFLTFLQAAGIHLSDDPDAPCASFPNFRCGGPIATPNFPAIPCNSVGSEEGGTSCMYGADIEPEALVCPGRTMCCGCHRLMEPRERDLLSVMGVRTRLQQRRLEFLLSRTRTAQRHQQISWKPNDSELA
mmetsp:Transcript_45935/g.111264  ORF Transcript_45935/g.111264 Transcript_45935/m.111264 type:complete len:230 (+) Transcript_45935:1221-1910(+)